MVSITNYNGIPENIFLVIQSIMGREHAPNSDASVTEILSSPREFLLKKRYSVTSEASEKIAAFLGTSVHYILEKLKYIRPDLEIEQKLVATFQYGKENFILSGTPDVYDPKIKRLIDYKTCSVYKMMKGDFAKWEQQANVYAYLLEVSGKPVKSIEVNCIFKDWKKMAIDRSGYPSLPSIAVPLPAWTIQQQQDFLRAKIEEKMELRNVADDKLPICSEEDRWTTPPAFAVMKEGNKRAVAVCDTKEDAELKLSEMKNKDLYRIEERPGIDKKCAEKYCDVREYCSYWKEKYSEQ